MQMEMAAQIRAEWERNHAGEKCNHSNVEKEYYLGAATGDYVCTKCGVCCWENNWPEKETNK